MAKETARWRANELSHIGLALVAAGDETNYEPTPGTQIGPNLSPVNDAAQAFLDAQTEAHPDKKAAKAPKKAKEGDAPPANPTDAEKDADLS